MRKNANTTANTSVCTPIDIRLVWPDTKMPPDPGGRVNNIPGLRSKNREPITTRSNDRIKGRIGVSKGMLQAIAHNGVRNSHNAREFGVFQDHCLRAN